MKIRTGTRRFLSLLMALVMVLSLLPAIVLAGESISVEKISTMEQLTTGQYVLVTSVGYAPGVFDNGWLTATTPTVNGSTIEGASAWTITVDGSTVKLTDSNGVIVAPKGGNNNGIIAGDYSWKVTCTDGTFTFAGQGTDTVVLASNVGSEGKFRAYSVPIRIQLSAGILTVILATFPFTS